MTANQNCAALLEKYPGIEQCFETVYFDDIWCRPESYLELSDFEYAVLPNFKPVRKWLADHKVSVVSEFEFWLIADFGFTVSTSAAEKSRLLEAWEQLEQEGCTPAYGIGDNTVSMWLKWCEFVTAKK